MIPRSPTRRASVRHLITPLATTALVLAACTSDDPDSAGTDDEAPVITPEPEPDAEQIDSDDGATEPSDDTSSTDSEPDESADTDLEPDPSADLPTARPDQVAPPTTVPGPLPTPSVQLIDEASYDQPIDATVRPGDVRMIVIERGGEVIAADAESSVTLFDVAAIAESNGPGFTNGGGEQGLLGLAFHPTDPFAYVHFSGGDGATVVAELTIDPASAEADPASYRELLQIEQPFGNHNGGELEFGPDGLLYLGLGDGGAADDPLRASLDPSTPLGSILRFDPTPSGDQPITIPADNPFVGVEGADPLIWSLGLRNPWKFSFDAVTGDLWIADVGQNEFEEINRAPADPDTGLDAGRGLDFGWSAFEAYEPFNDDQTSPAHTPPVAAYSHDGGACSVSGGVVARDSSYADLNGWYVYGDFCSGQLWALDTTSIPTDPSPENQPTIVEIGFVPGLTSVVAGPDGDIYTVSINGSVSRLAPA